MSRDDILAQTSCSKCEHNALVHESIGKHACTISTCACAYFVMPPRTQPSDSYVFHQYVNSPSDEVVDTAADIFETHFGRFYAGRCFGRQGQGLRG
jgi:hypothetical protein